MCLVGPFLRYLLWPVLVGRSGVPGIRSSSSSSRSPCSMLGAGVGGGVDPGKTLVRHRRKHDGALGTGALAA